MAGTPALGTLNSATAKVETQSLVDVGNVATTVDINAASGVKVTKFTATGNVTVTTSGVQTAGQQMVFIIVNDASGARTITFTTGFKPSATLVGTISKTATIAFESDGTNFYEKCRTLLL